MIKSYKCDQKHPKLEIYINNKLKEAIFDTGVSRNIITSTSVKNLNLKTIEYEPLKIKYGDSRSCINIKEVYVVV